MSHIFYLKFFERKKSEISSILSQQYEKPVVFVSKFLENFLFFDNILRREWKQSLLFYELYHSSTLLLLDITSNISIFCKY